jgi:hydroxyquinol 1,2-dioxygenase
LPGSGLSCDHRRVPGGRSGDEYEGPIQPEAISAAAEASFANCDGERLRILMQSLVRHLHAFVRTVELTESEWRAAIDVLAATGRMTDDQRNEFILWSDALGLSMLVDALAHRLPAGATESTVLGPFWVEGSPMRDYGESIFDTAAGEPAWVHGHVRDLDGRPIDGAELDVWQNDATLLYGVQDPEVPEAHLRGRFRARGDGSYAFVGVRPVPYPIPADGPVGAMLAATGRHPWRPAHLHMIVSAPGYETLATHFFDAESEYLDSDAVFAVKPSLLRRFVRRRADDPERPPCVTGDWWSVENEIVLAFSAAGS